MDLSSMAVIVSENFSEDLKAWMGETRPAGSMLGDRTEFPIRVELDSREIYYFRKKPFRMGLLYATLRKDADKLIAFQDTADATS